MKYIKLLLIALLFSVSANAQLNTDGLANDTDAVLQYDTVLSAKVGWTTVRIEPVYINMWDTARAVGLSLFSAGDNFRSFCIVTYELVDSMGNNLHRGNITISGDAYNDWSGNDVNVYPFLFVADKLRLQLK